jgi:hypothetical protein
MILVNRPIRKDLQKSCFLIGCNKFSKKIHVK